MLIEIEIQFLMQSKLFFYAGVFALAVHSVRIDSNYSPTVFVLAFFPFWVFTVTHFTVSRDICIASLFTKCILIKHSQSKCIFFFHLVCISYVYITVRLPNEFWLSLQQMRWHTTTVNSIGRTCTQLHYINNYIHQVMQTRNFKQSTNTFYCILRKSDGKK